MATIGELVMSLKTETAQFTAGLNKARGELGGFKAAAESRIALDAGVTEGLDDIAGGFRDAAKAAQSFDAAGVAELSQGVAKTAADADKAATGLQRMLRVAKELGALGPIGTVAAAGASAIAVAKWIDDTEAAAKKETDLNKLPVVSRTNLEATNPAFARAAYLREQEEARKKIVDDENARRAAQEARDLDVSAALDPLRQQLEDIGKTEGQLFAGQWEDRVRKLVEEGRLSSENLDSYIAQGKELGAQLDQRNAEKEASEKAAAAAEKASREWEDMAQDEMAAVRANKEEADRQAQRDAEAMAREASRPVQTVSAHLFGTSSAFSRETNAGRNPLLDVAKEQLAVQQGIKVAQEKMASAVQTVEVVRIG